MSVQHMPGLLVCWQRDGTLRLVPVLTQEERILALLIEAQETLDHAAVQARGTASEALRSSLAQRVRAAIATATGSAT